MASNIALYANTPLPDALSMTTSVAQAFFEGKPFNGWKQARDSGIKTQAAIVNRLNEVIRGLGEVAKAAAGRR